MNLNNLQSVNVRNEITIILSEKDNLKIVLYLFYILIYFLDRKTS
jgi:hypothetical protein